MARCVNSAQHSALVRRDAAMFVSLSSFPNVLSGLFLADGGLFY